VQEVQELSELSVDEVDELGVLESRLSDIRNRYRQEAADSLPDDELGRVLQARNERRLTPSELARADRLYRDWKYSVDPGADYVNAGTDRLVIISKLERLEKKAGAKELIRELAFDNSHTLSAHLFGPAGPPQEIQSLIQTYKLYAS